MKVISTTEIVKRVKSMDWKKYDYVVAVLRRGAPPAAIIALHLGLPMRAIYFESMALVGAIKGRLLIVDDVLAEGRTMKVIKAAYPDADFLVVVEDADSPVKADIALFRERNWVKFDWEDTAKVISGDRGLFRIKTSVYGENLIGYDMDGTIVEKTPEWVWKFGFIIGNIVRMFFPVKAIPSAKDFIIVSGRPKRDFVFTWLWLKIHKIKPRKIFLTGDLTSRKKVALVKELKLFKFYDDDENVIKALQGSGVDSFLVR